MKPHWEGKIWEDLKEVREVAMGMSVGRGFQDKETARRVPKVGAYVMWLSHTFSSVKQGYNNLFLVAAVRSNWEKACKILSIVTWQEVSREGNSEG